MRWLGRLDWNIQYWLIAILLTILLTVGAMMILCGCGQPKVINTSGGIELRIQLTVPCVTYGPGIKFDDCIAAPGGGIGYGPGIKFNALGCPCDDCVFRKDGSIELCTGKRR